MRLNEFEKNVLHAVRIEQPNANSKAIIPRVEILLYGPKEKNANKKRVSPSRVFDALRGLEGRF